MHSPEGLNNDSAKENEECREEQGQQGHHFSPKGRFANRSVSSTVFFLNLNMIRILEHCPVPIQKEDKNGTFLK